VVRRDKRMRNRNSKPRCRFVRNGCGVQKKGGNGKNEYYTRSRRVDAIGGNEFVPRGEKAPLKLTIEAFHLLGRKGGVRAELGCFGKTRRLSRKREKELQGEKEREQAWERKQSAYFANGPVMFQKE